MFCRFVESLVEYVECMCINDTPTHTHTNNGARATELGQQRSGNRACGSSAQVEALIWQQRSCGSSAHVAAAQQRSHGSSAQAAVLRQQRSAHSSAQAAALTWQRSGSSAHEAATLIWQPRSCGSSTHVAAALM
eukprot:TRINITY_DN421_c2_g1_i1.p1 TRINITY_DN421_c2_g1~~TRINITY_DN421_c2_g1_i1.p1  ORF type:complete len:134 (-),score=55.66 TRINITY_DN421_c2_g1_i1:76-477(-)